MFLCMPMKDCFRGTMRGNISYYTGIEWIEFGSSFNHRLFLTPSLIL